MAKLDLSLTADELNAYLREQRTVRVATVGSDGIPHVVPLWFVWDDGTMYLNSTLGNVTVENAMRTGRASAVADDGETYDALRGVVVTGTVDRLDDDSDEARVAERLWSEKFFAGGEVPYRRWRNRAWFRLSPERVSSWDFRKIPEARASRASARQAGRA
ncbi:MAG TPA: pyridoxamine 5'-phosphate oxidase family protein [Actinomycetota bacterium]|nr:pyridoxamine 5'-phosphate oxidase family protein [Actinomycetota bacterium]